MAADHASIVKLESVWKHLMVVSAQGAGICVAAAIAMRRIKSVTTMRRRIDMKAASALLHVLVIGLCECLVVEVFPGTGRCEWPVGLEQLVCGTNRPCRR